MASPAQPTTKRTAAAPPTSPIELLTDDILTDILLRLPTLADLGRAAASCAAFRRVVAGRPFLRRVRSVHQVPLLGLVIESKIKPAMPPHSSAPYARALAGAADLSFTFFPSHHRWHAADASDGRVLFYRFVMDQHAVCDPLSRRYSLLPQIPGNPPPHNRWDLNPFLIPVTNEETETSFRVVCMRYVAGTGQLVAFVFSSATGQWSSLAVGALVRPSCLLATRCYAYGCFYWKLIETDNLLVLDTRSMVFSLVQIPSGQGEQSLAIVEAGESRLGMFTVENSLISAASHLIYTIQEINEDGSSRWRFERRIKLPPQSLFIIAHATDRYLLLCGTPWNSRLGTPANDVQKRYFSFDLESMRIEKIHVSRVGDLERPILYTAFPPSLCLPSI